MAVTAAAQVQARDLTVTSWGGSYQDAQRKVFFEPFTEATGIKLVEDSWDGGIGPLRAKTEGARHLGSGRRSRPTSWCWAATRACIEPIDYSKIGGEEAFLPQRRARMRRGRHRLGHGARL